MGKIKFLTDLDVLHTIADSSDTDLPKTGYFSETVRESVNSTGHREVFISGSKDILNLLDKYLLKCGIVSLKDSSSLRITLPNV
ncbi:MAG: hypothetical protein IKD76_06790 [Clostridia bacterium]|nr:hypothetical protein [Clostridia bacterium]